MKKNEQAAMIDHTNLKAYADSEAMRTLCNEARERMMYYNQSTGARWGNPSSYDLCINTDAVSFEMAADSIARLAQNV